MKQTNNRVMRTPGHNYGLWNGYALQVKVKYGLLEKA